LSGWLPSRPFCHRGRKVRGESSSYKNRLFVGAALAATLASSRTGVSGLPKQSSPQPLRHRGRKVRGESPSYKDRLFVGAASAATLCVIEHRRFGFVGAVSVATLAPSKAEVQEILSEDRRWDGGQRRAVALLEPMVQRRQGGSLYPSLILQGYEPRVFQRSR
jgi:hypothetical protein